MDVEKSGNLIEAVLSFAVSLAFIVKAIRADRRLRLVFSLLATAFLVFGITDLIESGTGAWWSPPWLLALKATCVAAFAFGFAAYYKIVRRRRNEPKPPISN
jgi:hypothetical protein